MHATLLTSLNAPQVERVMNSRQEFLSVHGTQYDLQRKMSAINANTLLDSSFYGLGNLFGVWDDEATEMQGMVMTLFSAAQPCYFINKAYTIPGASSAVLPTAFKKIIEYHEELGYRRFYCMYPKSKYDVYQRLWRTSSILTNYSVYTEYESMPLERPKFQEIWELLFGRILYNETMLVRSFVNTQ
jgi:hypothetical protein